MQYKSQVRTGGSLQQVTIPLLELSRKCDFDEKKN